MLKQVAPQAFRRLTQPDNADPSLIQMGLSLRQGRGDEPKVYSYTGFRYKQPVTPLWLTVDNNRMIVSAQWRDPIKAEFTPFDYDRIMALISECQIEYPDVEFPVNEYQPDFEQVPWDEEATPWKRYGLGPGGRI